MNVLLINGSPHRFGCTHRALAEVAEALEENGIETEEFWIGNKPIIGCIGCGTCDTLKQCTYDDPVNEALERAEHADGFIFGSAVHYAAATGALTSFMDRLFYAGARRDGVFARKPAACVVSARRAGTTATFDQINKYFTIAQMPVVSSRYWNMVHGKTPADVEQDLEGLLTMRILGRNMAWLLKSIEAGKAAGIEPPKSEPGVMTNFIR